jgi:hypothetical protein
MAGALAIIPKSKRLKIRAGDSLLLLQGKWALKEQLPYLLKVSIEDRRV